MPDTADGPEVVTVGPKSHLYVNALNFERQGDRPKGPMGVALKVEIESSKNEEDEKKYKFEFGITADVKSATEDAPIFVCSTTLVVFLRDVDLDEDNNEADLMKRVLRFEVWPIFRELFSNCIQRADLPTPYLPPDIAPYVEIATSKQEAESDQ